MSDNPPEDEKLPPPVNLDPLRQPQADFGGLSTLEAISKIAISLNEINAKLSVQPLPNQREGTLDKILKIAEPVAGVFAKVTAGAGGGEMERRALDMFFQLGEGVMQTQILTNRAMQRRLGLDVLKEVPHAVVTG